MADDIFRDTAKTVADSFEKMGMFDPPPEAPVMVANTPICMIPQSEKKYRNFLAWWMEVGRLNPKDPQGWSSISGPWVMRGRVDLISPDEWAALPEEERQKIKAWVDTIPIGCFYDSTQSHRRFTLT